MEQISVRDLLEAGIHYGHRASRWNPKMRPYIYGKRKLIHIVDVRETLRGLITAARFLETCVARGGDVVFVGTKRQAQAAVRAAAEATGMHWVVERWIGGTLTNFQIIRSRVGRLDELEALQESGQMDQFSKKEGAALRRELEKVRRNLEGIRRMDRLPGALVIVDPHREKIAVAEANLMGIPVVALADTNCDPDKIDVLIPGNDDAMRAIQIVLERLAEAVKAGLARREAGVEVVPSAAAVTAPAETYVGRRVRPEGREEAPDRAGASRAGARTPQAVRPRRERRGRGPGRGARGPRPSATEATETPSAPSAPSAEGSAPASEAPEATPEPRTENP